jgi:hypothetical protein
LHAVLQVHQAGSADIERQVGPIGLTGPLVNRQLHASQLQLLLLVLELGRIKHRLGAFKRTGL